MLGEINEHVDECLAKKAIQEQAKKGSEVVGKIGKSLSKKQSSLLPYFSP
jgi:hypothetical protein